jgi:hypothetical protein
MYNIFFTIVILYIIINQLVDGNNGKKSSLKNKKTTEPMILSTSNFNSGNDAMVSSFAQSVITENANMKQLLNKSKSKSSNPGNSGKSEPKVWEFDKPEPWSKIILLNNAEYPYLFHIKIKIPSLNDYENWRQVVPNIDFSPQSRELIIPSRDEASALALANLILVNFMGQLSLKDILEKNLIQISIAKAKAHDIVRTKLKEQIMDNLYGKNINQAQTNYEKDLAKPNFKDETFTDTFQHFSEVSKASQGTDIDAFDGADYSYL